MTQAKIMRSLVSALVAVSALATLPAQVSAQPLSVRNSFRVGTSGVMCSAQISSADSRLGDMFDRAYRLNCRDAAGAIGTVLAVRRDLDMAGTVLGASSGAVTCGEAQQAEVEGIGPVESRLCREAANDVDYRRYMVRRGETRFMAEGLAGYDPVLRLALASIVNNRTQPGEVSVASTEVADAAAFARVQAGALDADGARTEAYARNNDGRFAESAEFFEVLSARSDDQARRAELIANAGLQQSNLGNFAAATAMFGRAEKVIARSDGVTQRLLRNYRAINFLNQRQWQAALAVLDAETAAVDVDYDLDGVRTGFLSEPLAYQINRENISLQRLGGIDSGLTLVEKAATLDAQADELRGTAFTQMGKLDDADAALQRAERGLLGVRNGRLVSALWLRSQVAMERGGIAEARSKPGEAGARYAEAVAILEAAYPSSPALLAARARQAGFLARSGDTAGARTQFAAVVNDAEQISDSSSALRDLLSPYFSLLVNAGDAEAPTALFKAVQSLQRPGVAQTQAVLARELSEGDGEASALFRLSVVRTREIARTEVEVANLAAIAAPGDGEIARLAAARQTLDALRADQTRLTAQLAKFPRYKAIAPTSVTLGDLQATLKPGEAYYKLTLIGDAGYVVFADRDSARIFRLSEDRAWLEQSVARLRDSIVQIENGEVVTYPFDIALARSLYVALMGPVSDRMAGVRHLIFEPDGPLLQIPPGILVTDDASVTQYKARLAKPNADDFDFTGTAWLGRDRLTTIAVSPRAFIDVRAIPPSRAKMAYLGVGNNAAPAAFPAGAGSGPCDWPLATWQNPIDPGELKLAQSILGASRSNVLTGSAFSDSTLGTTQLADYRIIHFATHGLVTAPRPQCPARPALVTSFGDGNSDGLLSFKEIFDLRLDADLVVLSACDTAGMATVSASRDAGVRTGGNYALDGLVRAFVGAGARSVIASHWPVPDDYGATNKLISGLYSGKPGQSVGTLLDRAQMKLMDVKETSHPFYWAAFVILGDADKPLLRR